jgi:hypothetical protein
VAQRLVSLFETLAKKHARLASQLRPAENGEINVVVAQADDMVRN